MSSSGSAWVAELGDRLWTAVAGGDEHAAVDVIEDALDAGHDRETLLLEVIGAVQERVGAEWAANRMSVAQEHAATAINERAIAAVVHGHGVTADSVRGRITVSCVDGEWHALPARLVAEVLRLRGWQVDYLGAQIPTSHMIAHLHATNPHAVLLSSSLPTHLPTAHTAIAACQAVGIPVLVGGRAFGTDGRYARAFGATRWAANARDAASALDAGLPRPDPTAARHAVDDLPHLSDQEYTMVGRSRAQLVKQTLVDLENRFPAMRSYSDEQRERTAEDLAHIVDFLTTALYVDDPDLFTTFVTWTADILRARSVPARSLTAGLAVLAEQLRDFPRATALLGQATARLTGPAAPSTPEPGSHA
ncbi:B12-binding domain-containing protein [Kitasatospora sp. NPDC059973]|uniref:cobalamin B12-binding domain-containing protein n=1 Tax=Kitasatospora sp. NPDC059973 TaxID=3347020 RepID=UPI0036ADF1C1